jgi:hypothetical protein
LADSDLKINDQRKFTRQSTKNFWEFFFSGSDGIERKRVGVFAIE